MCSWKETIIRWLGRPLLIASQREIQLQKVALRSSRTRRYLWLAVRISGYLEKEGSWSQEVGK